MKLKEIIISVLIIISFSIGVYSGISLIYSVSQKQEIKQDKNIEEKIKQTEKKYNKRIDSILVVISLSELERSKEKAQITQLKKQIISIKKEQKSININFKKNENEIFNSSDSTNWVWFKHRFPNTPNNGTTAATDTLIRK